MPKERDSNSGAGASGSIQVRAFAASDVAPLIDLFRDSVRHIAGRDYTESQVRAWAPDSIDASAWIHRCQTNRTFVAEIDGRIAGFAELTPHGVIHMLYVHKDFQRRGVATVLLTQVLRQAQQEGMRSVQTESSITAKPFFERHGFRIEYQQIKTVRGADFVNFVMTRRLTSNGHGNIERETCPAGQN